MRCSLEASMELAMIIRTKVTDYKSATEFNQQFFKNYSCEVAISTSIGQNPMNQSIIGKLSPETAACFSVYIENTTHKTKLRNRETSVSLCVFENLIFNRSNQLFSTLISSCILQRNYRPNCSRYPAN